MLISPCSHVARSSRLTVDPERRHVDPDPRENGQPSPPSFVVLHAGAVLSPVAAVRASLRPYQPSFREGRKITST